MRMWGIMLRENTTISVYNIIHLDGLVGGGGCFGFVQETRPEVVQLGGHGECAFNRITVGFATMDA